jgi:aspartyl-tRNA(Asn)/glutamyl-tRNA(Gln) amidotransferase subunit A
MMTQGPSLADLSLTFASDSRAHAATSLSPRFQSGDLSPVAYLGCLLAHIQKANPGVNALTSVQSEAALARARSLESKGPSEGQPLFGVPVVIKENIQKVGFPVQCGSRILEGYLGQFDATVVERLEAAGAILLATANMDEFAMGSSNETGVNGPVRNPHDPTRVSGGSSGGSAVACALGFAPVTLGSDTGGSVRQPAAFCGVYGFKPSYGRVSRHGLVAYGSSLDQIAPYARTAADLDVVLSVIAGEDPRDATTLPGGYVAHPDRATIAGARIGIPRRIVGMKGGGGEGGLDAQVSSAFASAERALRERGAVIIDVDIPALELAIPIYYVLACAEASSNLARYDGIRYGRRAAGCATLDELYDRSRAEGFGDEVKRRIVLGTFALSAGYQDAYYGRAQAARQVLCASFDRVFEEVDFVLTPTAPTPAFPLGAHAGNPLGMYLNDLFTIPANLARLCAVSVPAPVDAGGLPVGLHFAAPRGADAKLVALARALEEEGLCHVAAPKSWTSGGPT